MERNNHPTLLFSRLISLSLSVVFVLLIFFSSCYKSPCEDTQSSVYDNGFHFELVSLSGSTLIGVTGTRYDPKDVSYQKADGSVPPSLSISGAGTISHWLAEYEDPVNETIDKVYYLILPPTPQFNEIDYDTISISYRLSDGHDCFDLRYEDISVRYNDSLYNSNFYPNRYQFLKE